MIRKYFAGFDSLRFFAAFLVLLFHSVSTYNHYFIKRIPELSIACRGDEAVSFFFVLSGFLITWLLLNEKFVASKINFPSYFKRRMLRIWPLYFLITLIGFSFNLFIDDRNAWSNLSGYNITTLSVFFILFLPNFATVKYDCGAILNPTWSIGVEEQFYLGWPFLLGKFKMKSAFILMIVLFIFFLTIRYLVYFTSAYLETEWLKFFYSLKFYYMAEGGLIAWLLLNNMSLPMKLKRMFSTFSRGFHYLLIFCWLFLYEKSLDSFLFMFLNDLFEVYIFFWLIAGVVTGNLFKKPLWMFEEFGKISYGIYLWHMLVIVGIIWFFKNIIHYEPKNMVFPVFFVILVLVGTIVVSRFSYLFFESYFLKRKPQREE